MPASDLPYLNDELLDALDSIYPSRPPDLSHTDREKRYIIAQNGLEVGQKLISGESVSPDLGNSLPLSAIPLGTIISCIELIPSKGASIARSAGTFAQLMARDGKYGSV